MKIKVTKLPYETVSKICVNKKHPPLRPNLFWRTLMKIIAKSDLKKTQFSYTKTGMENLKKNEPCLILMNHSCFLDLETAESIFYPRPLNVVCTSDGFVGKNWLMRHIGCIPTNKFVSDFLLVKHIKYALTKLKTSVLMFPEASYSFDGTATPLPQSLAKCLKLLNVPVIMIKTEGAFLFQPLYNNLQTRNVKVTAEVKYLLSPQEIQNKSLEELNTILTNEFSFDNFKTQQTKNIKVTEPYRADFLNRVLYKCPLCQTEGKTLGKGTSLTCQSCGAEWELTETGFLKPEKPFNHIPDWYRWQRECVKKEIKDGSYKIETDVDIYMLVDTNSIYQVGEGHLSHTKNGFHLTGCDGKLDYSQKPKASYSLYSDYNWYEIGDMICIGDMKTLYYCFPKNKEDIAAKCRIATEELYKLETGKE
ncbi:MAG: 1-acyl-sn-glycerol-3-phosphate acyltransferase [Treponema sp.]|nr:1-acyl-sn-glycerol-3-phosphate acyltransferase [Candidatus Treponema merdequi]